MFGLRHKRKSASEYKIDSENLAVPEVHLAVPEVHLGEVEGDDDKGESGESIVYDNVAIPEIHIKKRKKKE